MCCLVWVNWKLGSPWRKYHEEHVVPLEKELVSSDSKLALKELSLRNHIVKAELFTRDFRAEILLHQKAKSAGFERLNQLKERKAILHKAQDEVRSDLNSWHQSSKSFFGSGGRKIKDNSILGSLGLEQTMAQKEALESRRASLSSSIRDLNDEMEKIYKQSINPAKEGIEAVRNDQKKLQTLRQDGLSEQYFRTEVMRLKSEITEIKTKILNLHSEINDAPKDFKKQRKSPKN